MGEQKNLVNEKEPSELAVLYVMANRCVEDIPHQLGQKIELLSRAQVIIGRLAADAVLEYKSTYAKRKRDHAEAFLLAKRDRAHHAEIAVYDLRIREAELEAEKVRWNNAFASNLEVINSLKYRMKVLLAEYNNPQNGR